MIDPAHALVLSLMEVLIDKGIITRDDFTKIREAYEQAKWEASVRG